nr:MAG TPA: hypothetical protein [Caudoviricetes sp.]
MPLLFIFSCSSFNFFCLSFVLSIYFYNIS